MNYKLKNNNPIEMIRMAENVNQKDFSEKLGYLSKDLYTYHMRQFTSEIVTKVKNVYGRDLTMEIINHLKCENRRLKQQYLAIKKELDKASSYDKSISSMLDKI